MEGSPMSSATAAPRIDFYIEDRESVELRLIQVRANLAKWWNLAAASLFSALLLLMHLAVLCPFAVSLIPLVVHYSLLVKDSLKTISARSKGQSYRNLAKSLIEKAAGLTFLSVIGGYSLCGCFPLWGAAAPLIVVEVLRMLLGGLPAGECWAFSWTVSDMQVRSVLRATRLLSVVAISLKLDGYTSYSWFAILSPCWFVLSLFLIISVCVLLLFLTSLVPCLCRPSESSDRACTLWLFWTFGGFSVSTGSALLLFAYVQEELADEEWLQLAIVGLIAFLGSFLSLTKILEERLIIWWDTFLEQSDEEEVAFAKLPSTPRSPGKSPQRLTLFPKVFARVSSAFLHPGKNSPPSPILSSHMYARRDTEDDPKVINVSSLELEVKGKNCQHCASLAKEHSGECHVCKGNIECGAEPRIDA